MCIIEHAEHVFGDERWLIHENVQITIALTDNERLSRETVFDLGDALQYNENMITSLELRGPWVGLLIHVLIALQENRTVRYLTMSGRRVLFSQVGAGTGDNMVLIRLAHNDDYCTLQLSKALSKTLKMNSTLKQVIFSPMYVHGLADLSNALNENISLETLELDFVGERWPITEEAALHIVRFVQFSISLTWLSLQHAEMDMNAVISILNATAENQIMSHLDLGSITIRGASGHGELLVETVERMYQQAAKLIKSMYLAIPKCEGPGSVLWNGRMIACQLLSVTHIIDLR